MSRRIFFITGTSSGFGQELVKKVLEEGDSVVATARNSAKLKFSNTGKDNFLALDCDVTDQRSVDSAFDKAFHHFGRIDVVVNNAGFGLSGEFESISDRQARAQMEVNFFGVVNVTRTALRVLRLRNNPIGGRILQVSSIGGQRGAKTFSLYCASKWAVEGFTEAVSQELKSEWNIHLTCIEPGYFKTNWGTQNMQFEENKDPAYDHINAKTEMKKMSTGQIGDPTKAARAFWELATMESPPLRMVVGSDAHRGITKKLSDYKQLYEDPKWVEFARSTDAE